MRTQYNHRCVQTDRQIWPASGGHIAIESVDEILKSYQKWSLTLSENCSHYSLYKRAALITVCSGPFASYNSPRFRSQSLAHHKSNRLFLQNELKFPPFAWRQQGGVFASPALSHSFLDLFDLEFMQRDAELYLLRDAVWVNALWRNVSLLWFTRWWWWRWIRLLSTSYPSVTPDDCL